ncbi:hypothetical protein [Aquiflexum lacus]|uniref:hypothetical protein n=1 Tax=Aquiflexum lacus TaxID=2483805 RepID=UPI001894E304|nr:hypothetical protein [Aquiflexum lacus]
MIWFEVIPIFWDAIFLLFKVAFRPIGLKCIEGRQAATSSYFGTGIMYRHKVQPLAVKSLFGQRNFRQEALRKPEFWDILEGDETCTYSP